MGREDLHHNMEDTFDDTEIIKTGDLMAYDCAYILGKARAHISSFFFSIETLHFPVGIGEREDPFFASPFCERHHRETFVDGRYFFPSFFPNANNNSDGRQRVLLPRPHRMGARSV